MAERDARRLKDSSFTDVERKRLDTAKQLLTIAIDEAATPAERQVAYRRVREELDGLISLSDEAIEVLEAKVSLELTTGASPQVPPEAQTPQTTTPDAAPPRDRATPPRPPQAAPGRSPRGAPTRPRVGSSAPSRTPDGDSMAWRSVPRHPLSADTSAPVGCTHGNV